MHASKRKALALLFILFTAIFLMANIVRMLSLNSTSMRKYIGQVIPYQVRLRETLLGKNGKSNSGCEVLYAVRSDGAYSYLIEDLNTKMPTSRRELIFPSGLTIEINDILEMKSSTLDKSWTPHSRIRDPKSNCMNSLLGSPFIDGQTIIGNEKIQGYPTIKIRYQSLTWWFAPELGCAMLKSRGEFADRGISEKNAVSIARGAPETNLFMVPTRYMEVAPSVLYGLISGSPGAKVRDNYYQRHRAQ